MIRIRTGHACPRSPAVARAAARRAVKEGTLVDKSELAKVERYLRRTFSNHSIRVVPRPKKEDSAEVYIGEEFVGVLFLDDEGGHRSYNFPRATLEGEVEECRAGRRLLYPQAGFNLRLA